MKTLFCTAAVAAFVTATAATASTITLDFDVEGTCAGGSGVTFSLLDNTTCDLQNVPGDTLGLGLRGEDLSTVRADFVTAASSVSVGIGDFGADADRVFLEIFDAADVSLGFTEASNPASFRGLTTLSLSASNIAYAVFGTNGDDLGFIGADNFTFTTPVSAVPLPAGGLLLLGGLAALGVTRRFKRNA